MQSIQNGPAYNPQNQLFSQDPMTFPCGSNVTLQTDVSEYQGCVAPTTRYYEPQLVAPRSQHPKFHQYQEEQPPDHPPESTTPDNVSTISSNIVYDSTAFSHPALDVTSKVESRTSYSKNRPPWVGFKPRVRRVQAGYRKACIACRER